MDILKTAINLVWSIRGGKSEQKLKTCAMCGKTLVNKAMFGFDLSEWFYVNVGKLKPRQYPWPVTNDTENAVNKIVISNLFPSSPFSAILVPFCF